METVTHNFRETHAEQDLEITDVRIRDTGHTILALITCNKKPTERDIESLLKPNGILFEIMHAKRLVDDRGDETERLLGYSVDVGNTKDAHTYAIIFQVDEDIHI